jgi:hypothetical protein
MEKRYFTRPYDNQPSLDRELAPESQAKILEGGSSAAPFAFNLSGHS